MNDSILIKMEIDLGLSMYQWIQRCIWGELDLRDAEETCFMNKVSKERILKMKIVRNLLYRQ